MIDPLAAEHGIEMRFPTRCGGTLQADRVRLKQVLLNLLSNAIRYNRPQGSVQVDCDVADDHAHQRARLRPGLTAEQVASLFEPFNRLGPAGRRAQGSGIDWS